MKVAFYAPMKSPAHPIPSGDRRMGQLFMQALKGAGFDVELVSEFRSFEKNGDPNQQRNLQRDAQAEALDIISRYKQLPLQDRPRLWFTYHIYHKAPDWIGPVVCKALGIPYCIAEASHAPKQRFGKWAEGYAAAASAILAADKVFHMTRLDGNCLKDLLGDRDTLVHLPPFVEVENIVPDAQQGQAIINKFGAVKDRFTLLCVAMMRSGDKLNSYTKMAEMLPHLKHKDWQLVVVGDGDSALQVKALFAEFGDRVIYTGLQQGTELQAIYAAADLYVWPACGEAFGMAFLEAGRVGTPAVAGRIRGVPDVVEDGVSGVLVDAADAQEMARQVEYFMDNPNALKQLSATAQQFVRNERSLTHTAKILKTHLSGLVT